MLGGHLISSAIASEVGGRVELRLKNLEDYLKQERKNAKKPTQLTGAQKGHIEYGGQQKRESKKGNSYQCQ